MRSQLGLFPRAASLAISLASERSKSFKVRRAGFVYGRAEETRARACRPVSPLKSQSVDDPGLEETGRRESRGERRTVKEKDEERRGEDREMRGERKEKRDIREGAKALVGGREMKWGLLWFRRWPVVTSSSARIDCSTRRGERPSDREWEGEGEKSLLSRETGSILLPGCGGCGGCCTSETLHLASSEGIVWARPTRRGF
ncbi:hypothetical protein ALC57_07149 [Trachymyrmex cornetzi]|uniref:Uncharacterized protein n=1 Tax=Trachymyrmex cornetzi TaxID=471704 RepID=A0A195E4X9_9HYME|nr:hypothetical protein ALC57_07149 [Trachymyrmex cornetzi]